MARHYISSNDPDYNKIEWTPSRCELLERMEEEERRDSEIAMKLEEVRKLMELTVPTPKITGFGKAADKARAKARSFAETYKRYTAKVRSFAWGSSALKRKFQDEDNRKREHAWHAEQDRLELERSSKAAAEHFRKQQAAIICLQGHGYKLGEDFNLENAVRTADEIAYEGEIEKQREKYQWIGFDGDSSCSDARSADEPVCRGWNMYSNRCDCGNRRVNFYRGDRHSFETPDIRAEAN
jgi:hypothetical protein